MSTSISSTVYGLTDVGVILEGLRSRLLVAQAAMAADPKLDLKAERRRLLRLIDDMERAQRFECSLTLVQRASITK